jgi:hypothetical protein
MFENELAAQHLCSPLTLLYHFPRDKPQHKITAANTFKPCSSHKETNTSIVSPLRTRAVTLVLLRS